MRVHSCCEQQREAQPPGVKKPGGIQVCDSEVVSPTHSSVFLRRVFFCERGGCSTLSSGISFILALQPLATRVPQLSAVGVVASLSALSPVLRSLYVYLRQKLGADNCMLCSNEGNGGSEVALGSPATQPHRQGRPLEEETSELILKEEELE